MENNKKSLSGKKILLGITGSISAYKAPIVVRELIRAGAEVKVAMTPSASKFVTKDVLINLSRHQVADEIFDENIYKDGAWHIHLAHWCDAYLIAPASATTLSRLASGNCDNTVAALYVALPREKKAIVAPAMDHDMYEHPATQSNIDKIQGHGTYIIEPEEGELSSGIIGKGRLPEPETLVKHIADILMAGNHEGNLLITAGPTRENIDDVRYLSNHSTGKMGVELANAAAQAGWQVKLVLGPIDSNIKNRISQNIEIIEVISAMDMMKVSDQNYDWADNFIMAAAVADYRPEKNDGKLKKGKHDFSDLKLIENPDILKSICQKKNQDKANKKVIGFALESEPKVQAIKYAKAKLEKKGCDLICLNLIGSDTGIGSDTNNLIFVYKKEGKVVITEQGLISKAESAQKVIQYLSS